MLPLVLMCRQQVELGDVGIHKEFEIQLSKRGQADQGGRWRECGGQTRARAVIQRSVPGERRRSNIMEILRVVDVKTRIHGQHFVEGQWSSTLVVDGVR